jgi:antitoxin FitA
MSTLTIRNLDDDVKARLRVRAAQNGRSMEAEAREILKHSVEPPAETGVGARLRARLAGLRLDELEIPPRTDMPRDIDFGE